MKGRTLADCHRAAGGKVDLGGGISAPRYGTQPSVTNEAKKGTTGILSSSNAAPKSFSKRGKFRHGGAVKKKAEGGAAVKDWSGEGDSGKDLRAKAKAVRDEPNFGKALMGNVGQTLSTMAIGRKKGPGFLAPAGLIGSTAYAGKKYYDSLTEESRAKKLEDDADKAEGRKSGGRAKRADGGPTPGEQMQAARKRRDDAASERNERGSSALMSAGARAAMSGSPGAGKVFNALKHANTGFAALSGAGAAVSQGKKAAAEAEMKRLGEGKATEGEEDR